MKREEDRFRKGNLDMANGLILGTNYDKINKAELLPARASGKDPQQRKAVEQRWEGGNKG